MQCDHGLKFNKKERPWSNILTINFSKFSLLVTKCVKYKREVFAEKYTIFASVTPRFFYTAFNPLPVNWICYGNVIVDVLMQVVSIDYANAIVSRYFKCMYTSWQCHEH